MASVRQKHRKRRLGFWLLIALVFHAEAILVVGLSMYFYSPREADLELIRQGQDGESIQIADVDDQTAQRLLAELDREEEKAKEEEAKKERESKQAPGQVVDLAKPIEEKHPDDAKFAAEFDSSVEKETKKFGRFDQKAQRADNTGEPQQARPAVPRGSQSPAPPGALAMRSPTPSRNPGKPSPPAPAPTPQAQPVAGEEGPAAPPDPDGIRSPGGRVQPNPLIAPRPPGGGARVPPGSTAALTPSQEQIARAIGSGTQDHLKDIDDGDETALNAKKWKFASFFNRVKSQVRDRWRPAEVYRRRDPTGSIYGNKDRYTLLHVQLKPDGTLANVMLETPSGVEFLDDEAIEAFKQAQPFPNPPPQLVVSGTIDFSFGFYFELSGAPRFKVFRYNSM